MDWIKALKLLLDGKGIYDKAKEVKKLSDYSSKIGKQDPSSLKWDEIKYFKNKQMDQATTGLRQILKNSRDAEKAKLKWPVCNSLPAWVEWAKVLEKHGAKSAQYKKAKDKYVGILRKFEKDLITLETTLKSASPALAKNVKIADAMVKYGDLMNKTFMKMAKVPSFGGTAQQAMFFTLSQDALQYKGLASDVHKSMGRLVKLNTDYQKECAQKIKDNQSWIKFSLTPAVETKGVIQKNTKAVKPKK